VSCSLDKKYSIYVQELPSQLFSRMKEEVSSDRK
jgi:hypothetical protein